MPKAATYKFYDGLSYDLEIVIVSSYYEYPLTLYINQVIL